MRLLAGILAAMSMVFAVVVLAYADVIDLPGSWRTKLGLAEETPNPPCRVGMYRVSPSSPPPSPGRWRTEPEAPKSQVEGSAAAIGPVIYIAGGARPGNLHTVLAFDTRSGQWSEPTRLPVGLNHSPAVAYRGDLYLAGGFREGETETDSLWRYEPQRNRWTELAPMPRARGGAAAAVLADHLYVIGGGPQPYGVDDPEPPSPEVTIYDFESDTWRQGPPVPVAAHHFSAAVVEGRIYVAGGRLDHERSTDSVSVYEPVRERWRQLPDLPTGPMSSLGVVDAGGEVVIFGGDDEVDWEDGGGVVSASAWALDTETERWRRLPDLTLERHAFGAAVAGGRIYAIAGAICPGLKPNGPVGTHTVESLPIPSQMPG
jgi:N-acetylneuraminic acid mutarotase